MVTRTIENIEFWGNDLALDFANTLEGARGEPPDKDHLTSHADLVTWARRAGALPGRARLRAGPRPRPRAAAAIYDVFSALASGEQPPRGALRSLLAVHADAVREGTIEAGDGCGPGVIRTARCGRSRSPRSTSSARTGSRG